MDGLLHYNAIVKITMTYPSTKIHVLYTLTSGELNPLLLVTINELQYYLPDLIMTKQYKTTSQNNAFYCTMTSPNKYVQYLMYLNKQYNQHFLSTIKNLPLYS